MDEKVSGFMCSIAFGIPHKYAEVCKNSKGELYVRIDWFSSQSTFTDLNDSVSLWKCVREVQEEIIKFNKISSE